MKTPAATEVTTSALNSANSTGLVLVQSTKGPLVDSASTMATMSSREIAELTGKEHFHVKRDIEGMLRELQEDATNFGCIYLDSMNREQVEYRLDRELTDTLLTGYSAVLRRRVIARWRELEAGAKPALPNYADALRQLADKVEENQALAIERDYAIATKAQIGSKREATAMATAAQEKRRAAKMEEELGRSTRHATVTAVEGARGKKFGEQDWRPLKAWCQANGSVPVAVPCPRYGNVKAWPAAAWLAVHGVDLVQLFGRAAA